MMKTEKHDSDGKKLVLDQTKEVREDSNQLPDEDLDKASGGSDSQNTEPGTGKKKPSIRWT